MEGVHIKQYDNGFELRYKPEPIGLTLGTLHVGVDSGYERPEEYRISHFIEHTVMTGGTKRVMIGLINLKS